MKLTGANGYDTQMTMHYGTSTIDVSLAQEFQKYLFTATYKHLVIDKDK